MLLKNIIPYNTVDAGKYNKFRWWLGITLGDMLDKAADIYPDKEGLVDNANRLSYSQIREKSERLAVSLMELGIKKQDRVLLQLPNWGEFVYTYFAIQKIGAIVVLLLARHAQTEINHLCRLTDATTWIVGEKYRSINYLPIINDVKRSNPSLKHIVLVRSQQSHGFLRLEELIDHGERSKVNLVRLAKRRPNPMEVAHMGPTGGTTGLPKIAPRTHNDFITNVEYVARAMELSNQDVNLVITPVGHNLSLRVGICATIFAYGKIIMLDSTDPRDILSVIDKEKVTAIAWVPPLATSLVNYEGMKQFNVSSLKKMYLSTQASPAKLIKDVNEKLGCRAVTAYGATEGYHIMTRLNYDQSIIHLTVGRPTCPYDNYKVVDANGKEVPPGTPGELLVKGPGVFSGYYNAPEENAKAFTEDGFLKTGDQLTVDASGNYYVTGRIKDIIKRAGENISPLEIEQLINTHPHVVQVSVVGMPDPSLGERACAYIQTRPGVNLCFEDIISYLKSKGASVLQLPERVEFVDGMPMTKAGKADKKPLREDIRRKLIAEGIIKEN